MRIIKAKANGLRSGVAMVISILVLFAGALVYVAACTTPNILGQPFTCTTDDDCVNGDVCGTLSNGDNACVAPQAPCTTDTDCGEGRVCVAGAGGGKVCVAGAPSCATDADCKNGTVCGRMGNASVCVLPIRVGMSTALSGVSSDLGKEMWRGVGACFEAKNGQGGVQGRALRLVALDDGYEPKGALTNTYELLDIDAGVDAGLFGCDNVGTPNWQGALNEPADTLGPNRIVAMLGNVGTPTMLCSAPVCLRNNVIFFAPFTGARTLIRDPAIASSNAAQYIFNFRASYADETAAMVTYLTNKAANTIKSYKEMIAFAQDDTYGLSGYQGLAEAWKSRGASLSDPTECFSCKEKSSCSSLTCIKLVKYKRNTPETVSGAASDAEAYLQELVQAADGGVPAGKLGVGIAMVPTYAPAAQFVKNVLDWQSVNPEGDALALTFMSVSFVGADALLKEFTSLGKRTSNGQESGYGDGVWVTQVVPHPNPPSEPTDGILRYQDALKQIDPFPPSWGSLEGYLGARLFVDGLEKYAQSGGSLDATTLDVDKLVAALEELTKDTETAVLDIGAPIGFASASVEPLPDGHQASKNVWLSRIEPSGAFSVVYLYYDSTLH